MPMASLKRIIRHLFPAAGRPCRGDRGAVAVEFALVGPIFLLLVVMILELGLVQITQSNLDFATDDAARLIRVGTIQTGGGSTAFRARICADVGALIPCGAIQYNVQAGNSFGGLNSTIQTNAGGDMVNTQFTPGTPGQYVLVQVGYNRNFLMAWAGSFLGSNNKRLLMSTVAFQNEIYQ